MKKVLLAGVGVVLLAGGGIAIAQTPPAPPGPPPGAEGQPPGPPHGPGGMRGGMMGGWGQRERGGPPFMRAMMEASKAAHFRFRRGENMVDIKCAADESTKACVDAAGALLDKLGAQPAR